MEFGKSKNCFGADGALRTVKFGINQICGLNGHAMFVQKIKIKFLFSMTTKDRKIVLV